MRDLTQVSIVKSLVSLAVPIVLTNLLHTAYQLIDTFWVGRLGAEAVAAVSLSFPFIFLIITLGGGLSLAGTILVSQYKGSKNDQQVNHVATQTMVSMFIISIFLSIIGYNFSQLAMELIGAAPEVLPQAVSYLKISFIGIIFLFTFFVFQSLMRGVGETKTPLYLVFMTVMLNLVLDPILIMGWGPIPAYGISGAAIATILTQSIASILGILILIRGNYGIKITFKNFHFDRPLIKKMFFLGMPSSIEQSMKAIGLTLISYLVASFGTVVVAAYGIGIRILSFVIIPAFGLSMATSTLVGQNMGAQKPDRAEKVGNQSSLVAFVIITIVSAVIYYFAPPITRTFIPDNEKVIEHSAFLLRFLCMAFPFIGLQLNLSGVFSGSGNTKVSMFLSLLSLWAFEFPAAYFLSHHTSLGEFGIWIASPIAAFLTATIAFAYYKSGKWKETNIISSQPSTKKLEKAVRDEVLIEEGIN